MIFSLLIIHSHDRMSSITWVLHTATWSFFTSDLPYRFRRSPKVVKEAIMTDINDLVQEFWRNSSGVTIGAPFFEMRCLLGILEKCIVLLGVRFGIASVFATAADKDVQSNNRLNPYLSDLQADDRIRAKFKRMLDGYRNMIDHSFSKSKDLHDMLRLLPGVVVQKKMSMRGMADLYRIKLDLLECLVNSTIEPLRSTDTFRYTLDIYLSAFLQDRDRSQLYYCDPMLQHISICRNFLSLLDGSNAFDLHS